MRIIFTSAKSVLMRPGVVMRSVMPCTPCSSTSSAILNAFNIDVRSSLTCNRRSFGMMMIVSTFSFSFWMPVSACTERRRPSKPNGRVTTPIVNAPMPRAISATSGARAGAGAAALARGDEHHVGALQHLFDLLAVLLGGLPADLGIGTRAEAARELRGRCRASRRRRTAAATARRC